MKKSACITIMLVMIMLFSGCSKDVKQEAKQPTEWPAADGSVHIVLNGERSREEQELLKRNPQWEVNHLWVDEVAVIEIYDKDGTGKPILLMFNEQGGKKEQLLQASTQYVDEGFFCVLMDMPGYGERIQDKTIESLEACVLATADIDLLLDYYRLHPEADVNRFAMWGFSMGGSAIYQYVAYGKRTPRAIAVACTSPDYTTIGNMGSVTNGKEAGPTWSEGSFKEYAQQHNPIDKVDRFINTSILSFNGLADKVIPPDGSQELEELLKVAGKRDMEFVYQEGVSHEISREYEERILPFLIQAFAEK